MVAYYNDRTDTAEEKIIVGRAKVHPFPVGEVDVSRCVDKLRSISTIKKFPKNSMVAAYGEVITECYMLVEGAIVGYDLTSSGDESAFLLVDPGFLFLVEQCFALWNAPLYYKAIEDTTVLVLKRADLLAAMEKDFELSLFFLGDEISKRDYTMTSLKNTTLHSVMWNMCELLVHFVVGRGEQISDDSYLIHRKTSQQVIGNLLRVNRITVVRYMAKLKDEGLLGKKEGFIHILSLNKLIDFQSSLEE